VESIAERGQAIGHPLQAGTVPGGRGVKPGSVVGGEFHARRRDIAYRKPAMEDENPSIR
jgi:hypothetical protein